MIQREVIKQVILDYRNDVERQHVIERQIELENYSNYVLVGVRRAGKSFLLYQQIQKNLRAGISWDEMLYINFEDERLMNMEASDLNLILEVHGSMSSARPILFLDEIQNIPGWDKFVRRLSDSKYRVYVTGSNAKMLSHDVATTLGGRYAIIHVFPYSFKEYLLARGVSFGDRDISSTEGRATVQRCFSDYFYFGGYPECVALSAKREYLTGIYQKIYLGDIVARHRLENTFALRVLFSKLAESVKQPLSFSRMSNILSSIGVRVGKSTVINYIEYAKNAFLLLPVKNMADNLTQRESRQKYYFVDNGIISLLASDVETSLLENLVAIELLRRNGTEEQVYFYNHNVEVDFYVPDTQTAIQVCYAPHKSEETLRREVSALTIFNRRIACRRLLILSYEEESTIEHEGFTIDVIPVWKWLIEK